MPTLPVQGVSPTTLSEATKKLILSSLSENTKKIYAGALKKLEAWLSGRELTDALLAQYLAHCHEQGLAPSTIALIPAAVRFSARLTGKTPPIAVLTERTLAGIRREGKHRGAGQVTGITFSEVKLLVQQIAQNGIRGKRDAAMFSLMSDCMLRISELTAVCPVDIVSLSDGSGRLRLPQSKTDQEGMEATLYIGPPTMKYIQEWVCLLNEQFEEVDKRVPLFRSMRRGGIILPHGISVRAVRKNIDLYTKDAGLRGRFSGHSFRVGTAQSLAQKGATIAQMQTVGRWKSPAMPAIYCRNELAGRSAVATLLYNSDDTVGGIE
ncbi:MAG: tyrosine-type recombinase/integrase [Bacteroidetes bacterium]|nr:tyrosine-type recombinase/integrase [Bacteroidota bacterium]MCY4204597.1 tyrosine-type recombinase/integrase [Bacteroidota bacterium]